MPIFHFHFRQGEARTSDIVGCEFANFELAYLDAFKVAQEMWSGLLAERINPLSCAFEVTDAYGREVMVVDFSEVFDNCRKTEQLPAGRIPFQVKDATLTDKRAKQASTEMKIGLSRARAQLNELKALLGEVDRFH